MPPSAACIANDDLAVLTRPSSSLSLLSQRRRHEKSLSSKSKLKTNTPMPSLSSSSSSSTTTTGRRPADVTHYKDNGKADALAHSALMLLHQMHCQRRVREGDESGGGSGLFFFSRASEIGEEWGARWGWRESFPPPPQKCAYSGISGK